MNYICLFQKVNPVYVSFKTRHNLNFMFYVTLCVCSLLPNKSRNSSNNVLVWRFHERFVHFLKLVFYATSADLSRFFTVALARNNVQLQKRIFITTKFHFKLRNSIEYTHTLLVYKSTKVSFIT